MFFCVWVPRFGNKEVLWRKSLREKTYFQYEMFPLWRPQKAQESGGKRMTRKHIWFSAKCVWLSNVTKKIVTHLVSQTTWKHLIVLVVDLIAWLISQCFNVPMSLDCHWTGIVSISKFIQQDPCCALCDADNTHNNTSTWNSHHSQLHVGQMHISMPLCQKEKAQRGTFLLLYPVLRFPLKHAYCVTNNSPTGAQLSVILFGLV